MNPTGSVCGRSHSLTALAAVGLTLAVASLVLLTGDGTAAPAAKPTNVAEPDVDGRAEQGRTLSTTRGRWNGTSPISYAFRWVRCGADGGRPDGSDCGLIIGATSSRYRIASADVGSRLRVRVTATNAEGAETVASNPTAVVVGPPVNTSIPLVTGSGARRINDDRAAGDVGRAAADLVLLPVAPLQQRGRRLRGDRGRDRQDVPAHVRRRRPQGPRQRHGQERDRSGDRHVRRVGGRQRPAAGGSGAPAVGSDLDPRDERSVRSSTDRVAGRVLAEPGHEPAPRAHRADPGARHARLRRAGRHSSSPARRRGSRVADASSPRWTAGSRSGSSRSGRSRCASRGTCSSSSRPTARATRRSAVSPATGWCRCGPRASERPKTGVRLRPGP